MLKFVFWIAIALLMIICCILGIIAGDWLRISVSIIALVLDITQAIISFDEWHTKKKINILEINNGT